MTERRKRFRNSSGSLGDCSLIPLGKRSTDEGESSGQLELQGTNFRIGAAVENGGSSVSKCSVKLIYEVVSKFNQTKKDLVKSIGFEAILVFPYIKQFNRKFTLWLMTSVNKGDATINIAPDIIIKFDKRDIHYVIGVPAEGRAVLDPFSGTREARDKVIHQYLGNEFKEHRRIKIVQEIVERDYGNNMCKADADKFKVAFVVFVVSNLLAPSSKYDYASVDYWNAIKDPEEISTYDWADFVFTKLIEGVTKLKQDISNNIKFPNITGCVMFLQVFYLDSIYIEGLSLPHTTFPRVRDFTFDRIKAMILADQNFKRHIKGDLDMPPGECMQLRKHDDCIYSWAACKRQSETPSRAGCLTSIWEAALAFVQHLNLPVEASGPLFIAALKFEDHVKSGAYFNGVRCGSFLNDVASLLIPYIRGYRQLFNCGNMSIQIGNCQMQNGHSNGKSLMSYPICNNGCWPHYHHVDRFTDDLFLSACSSGQHGSGHVNGISDEFVHPRDVNEVVSNGIPHLYPSVTVTSPMCDFDLNAVASCASGPSSSSSIFCGDECQLPTPWDLGYGCDVSGVFTEKFIEEIKSLQDEHSIGIVHRTPKYIQVSTDAMVMQFLGEVEMELDLFDALVRVAKQEDDMLFSSYGRRRWRYFLESDFMFGILSGAFDLFDQRLGNNLCLNDSLFDIRQAHIVFIPALIQSQWACFAWVPKCNVIYAFDPSCGPNVPEIRLPLLERACYMLKLALRTLCASVFKGMSNDVSMAEVRMTKLLDTSPCRLNSSGFLCSMFYRCFDGVDLVPKLPKVCVQGVAAMLFNDLRKLKDNTGTYNCHQ